MGDTIRARLRSPILGCISATPGLIELTSVLTDSCEPWPFSASYLMSIEARRLELQLDFGWVPGLRCCSAHFFEDISATQWYVTCTIAATSGLIGLKFVLPDSCVPWLHSARFHRLRLCEPRSGRCRRYKELRHRCRMDKLPLLNLRSKSGTVDPLQQ